MQRIGFIVTDGFQMLGLAAQTVFEYANLSAGRAVYEVHVLSEKGRPVRSSIGMALQTERFGDIRFDTLVFNGTNDAAPPITSGLLGFARRELNNLKTRGVHMYRRIYSRRSGPARRSASNNPLGFFTRIADALSQGHG